jgi:hypothetical protein
MDVIELYRKEYAFETEVIQEGSTKYTWAASQVFGLTSYDRSLDELFVKKIIDVCKAILEGRTFEYIRDGSQYVTYILVCQLLERLNWIEWGTSIRGAWFEESHEKYHPSQPTSQPILKYLYSNYEMSVPFTVDNLKALIEFMEE